MTTHCSITTAETKITNWFKSLHITKKQVVHKIDLPEVEDIDAIEIFIKTLTGATSAMKTHPNDLVEDLKLKIFQQFKVPVDKQRLIYQQNQLQDGNTLDFYRIRKDSTIHLAVRLIAGVQVSIQTKNGQTISLDEKPKKTFTGLLFPKEKEKKYDFL